MQVIDNRSLSERVTVPERFNGPLDSGQGGYCAGRFADLVGGAGEVSLRRPVPLDTPLDVVRHDYATVRVLDNDGLVAEVRATDEVGADLPATVSVAEAREASKRYRGLADGVFSRCFVCGRAREDAFGVFAGAVDGRPIVASPWTPPAWTADQHGHVRAEFVWAALDCPTYFALYPDGELPLSVLARLTARTLRPVTAGEEQIVIAWPIELDGRKHHAGAAVISADGTLLAVARALLIAPRTD
jgi:hypothetical protein